MYNVLWNRNDLKTGNRIVFSTFIEHNNKITIMKHYFFYLFLAMNLFLVACSSGDTEDSEQLD